MSKAVDRLHTRLHLLPSLLPPVNELYLELFYYCSLVLLLLLAPRQDLSARSADNALLLRHHQGFSLRRRRGAREKGGERNVGFQLQTDISICSSTSTTSAATALQVKVEVILLQPALTNCLSLIEKTLVCWAQAHET